jgi:drug/metabolite transporter (DMT)-like permease
VFTFAIPIILPLVIIEGIPLIKWKGFLLATFTSVGINVFAWNLFFKALRVSSLAHTMPFTAFTPIFIIPIAYVLLNELPDIWGVLGILLIIAGAYGIHLDSANLLLPFKQLFHNRGTRYMLIVSMIWSVSATVEKVAVLDSSPSFYALFFHCLMAIIYLVIVMFKEKNLVKCSQKEIKGFLVLGLISGFLILFQFTALKYLLVSYVIAIKRAGVLVSVFFGVLFYNEKHPLKNIFCTALMVTGVFLIVW